MNGCEKCIVYKVQTNTNQDAKVMTSSGATGSGYEGKAGDGFAGKYSVIVHKWFCAVLVINRK